MNELEAKIVELGMDSVRAMNALQDAGIVSDNCVSVSDVSPCEMESAILFLSC